MSSGCLWCVAMLAACCFSMTAGESPPMVVPIEFDALAPSLSGGDASSTDVEVPAGVEGPSDEKRETKRSERACVVRGRTFRHGEVFSYPGYSHCLRFRCNNGRYNLVQSACERNGQCILVGSVFSEQCRSLLCVRQNRGNMLYFHLEPTRNDMCSLRGDCVPKNQPFVHSDCYEYECTATVNCGYNFRILRAQCMDDSGACIPVGQRFTKTVNRLKYTNCICNDGGRYSCRF